MFPESSIDSTLDLVARQILIEYQGLAQPTRLVALQSGGGFSGARLWRVELPAGPLCLRAMPADRLDLQRLTGLHRLLAHVGACGLTQVAVPLRRQDGATFVVKQSWAWQLEPWMPGVADFSEHPSTARLQSALMLLARWHQASRTFPANETESAWFAVSHSAPSPGINERLSLVENWSDRRRALIRNRLTRREWPAFDALGLRILELYGGAAPRVTAELAIGRRIEVPLQPCLRDVWHDHVLFTGDEVTGLIDAHACRADNVATDLARLLGSLAGDDRTAWDIGLAAYEQVRALSVAERGLLELFDRSAVLLSGLTWLEWKALEQRRFEQPEVVLLRLREIVQRLERLAPFGSEVLR